MIATRNPRLIADGDSLVFSFGFDRLAVDALKREIPSTARRFDGTTKSWLIDPAYGAVCTRIARSYFGVDLVVPSIAAWTASELRLLEIAYIGRCKPAGDGSVASAWTNGGWNAAFSEAGLRTWFQSDARPGESPTLYAALGVARNAVDSDVRSAFRRLARQWHPDVCREADAAEQFKRIKRAYDVLSEPTSRRKYDAGLALEASQPRSAIDEETHLGYRSPLRCGAVFGTGRTVLGRFIYDSIEQWEDIVDGSGRVMVSSWPRGAAMFEVDWL